MSSNINIQKLDHRQTEQDRIAKLNYNFANILRALNGELQVIKQETSVTTVHNELQGRSDTNCHPITSIAGLSSEIGILTDAIVDLTEAIEDHEERIKALEEG